MQALISWILLGASLPMLPLISDGGAAGIVMVLSVLIMAIVEIGAMVSFFGNALILGALASAWLPFFVLKGRGSGHWLGRPLLALLLIVGTAAVYVVGGFSVMMNEMPEEGLTWMQEYVFIGMFLSIGGSVPTLAGMAFSSLFGPWFEARTEASIIRRAGRGLTRLLLGAGSASLLAVSVGVALNTEAGAPPMVLTLGLLAALALGVLVADTLGWAPLQEKPMPAVKRPFLWTVGVLVQWAGFVGLGLSVLLSVAMVMVGFLNPWPMVLMALALCLALLPTLGLLRLGRVGGALRKGEEAHEE